MHRITLILILFLLLPDMYIYLVYIVKKTRSVIRRSIYWLPTVVLVALYLYYIYMAGENALSRHPQSIGRLAVAVMLFAVPKTVFMLCSLLGILMRGISRFLSFAIFRTPFRNPRFPFVAHRLPYTLLGLILGTITFANILYGAIVGIKRFEVKDVEYHSTNLPKGFDGYRILQLSDIHIGSWQGNPEAIRQLVNLVNEQKADLIVFTGDLVNQQSHELDSFKEILSQLHAPGGVYSVLGNHDYGTYYRWHSRKEEVANLEYLIEQQKDMGWKMLNNDHTIIHHKSDSIALIGVENDGEPPFSQFADFPKAIQGTEGMFRILLSHNPTHWRREVLPAGLEVVRQIYPKLSMTPGILLAPRFSMDATVAAALQAKTKEINGVFKAVCIVDIDSTTSGATKYTDVKQRKEAQAVSDANAYAVWPCAKVGEVVYSGSALAAALTAYTDAVNADTPNVSPSNKTLAISAACLADGTEVVLDQEQANTVNGFGVATFLNMSGFRLWGNNTAAYPGNTDPKDRWFSVRRFLSWAANSFILTYFSKVDSPANKRLIEAIVDSENVRGNGFVARGVCARYEVIYDEAENATADLLDGKITFHQYITPYTPAEDIEDVIEFDPDALTTALS